MTRNPAVKPVPPPFRLTRSVGPVTLYLSDIDAIVERLRRDTGDVIISAGTSTASTAQDLRDSTRLERSNLMIQIDQPRVDIHLQPKRCQVETTDDDDFARSIVEDAVSLLEQHRRNLFPRFLLQTALTVAAIGFAIAATWSIGNANWLTLIVVGAFLIGGYSVMAVLANRHAWRSYLGNGRTRVILRDRQESNDRRVTMATTIWVGIGGAALGGILGAVATALLGT
jgi:hypothetical protein